MAARMTGYREHLQFERQARHGNALAAHQRTINTSNRLRFRAEHGNRLAD
jgi:hypothetical protein